jgi:hypothetical protein
MSVSDVSGLLRLRVAYVAMSRRESVAELCERRIAEIDGVIHAYLSGKYDKRLARLAANVDLSH